ncbi:MAG: zinc-ribbon domain-containing protein [Anaerolineae bacterium]
MSICLRCDAPNPDGANFCARCGNSLVNQHPDSSTAPLSPSGRATYAPQNPQLQVWVAPPPTQESMQQYPPTQVQPPY